ncbi:MAG: DUF805 domain-containing protein [Kiritimatiellae bacterium]|nr:DUF805 domain-containing protein [Kiritimatiellia bacterium]
MELKPKEKFKWLSFKGRISRKTYWRKLIKLFVLAILIPYLVVMFLTVFFTLLENSSDKKEYDIDNSTTNIESVESTNSVSSEVVIVEEISTPKEQINQDTFVEEVSSNDLSCSENNEYIDDSPWAGTTLAEEVDSGFLLFVCLLFLYCLIFGSIFLIFLFPLTIRRLHDLGLSGCSSLVFLFLFFIPIPYVFTILICILGCIKGNPAKNKYDLESETNPSEIQNNQQK